ncbi:MAG: proteasome subunit alpha, partial [Ilumatobacteraceae bacterium]
AGYVPALDLGGAVRLGVTALAGPDREIPHDELEVARLARGNGRRCFERVSEPGLGELLA